MALLDSGVSLELSMRRELSIGILPRGSSLCGQPLQTFDDWMVPEPVELVAILRNGKVVLPEPGTLLAEADRLLVLSAITARRKIREQLAETRNESVGAAGVQG